LAYYLNEVVLKNLYTHRFAGLGDEGRIMSLYKTVAGNSGVIAREAEEVTPEYIRNNLGKSSQNGICLVVENPDDDRQLLGEIHCYKLEPAVFNHILSELTIVVHPDFQNKGIGKLLFTSLLKHIEEVRNDIFRVELIVRESNTKAQMFYQKIGFTPEGRFEKRIDTKSGSFEADIPMAWFNKNFKR
jgi:ribosomal protein S18 acetylase RimI-like enzyme